MAHKQYGYEMEERGQRGGGYSGGGGDPYGRDQRSDRYDLDSRRDQYGRDSRKDNYGMDSREDHWADNYGMEPRGDRHGRGGREQHYDMGDGQGAVSQQPGRMGFSQGPGFSGAPPGLEYLAQIDQLLVQQQIELCEIFTGCETKNQYKVKNSMGQEVYTAKEDTNWCNRQCCGPLRSFDMQIFDGAEREVLHLSRPLRCQGCCFPCCLQQLEVCSSGGQVLGTIRERWTFLKPKLTVHRPDGEHVFTIRGPICKCSCCGGDVNFRILTADEEQEVGIISKQWSGLAREWFTDSDTFGVTFPIDLDVSMKATLFGALFLVDFMFFERSN